MRNNRNCLEPRPQYEHNPYTTKSTFYLQFTQTGRFFVCLRSRPNLKFDFFLFICLFWSCHTSWAFMSPRERLNHTQSPTTPIGIEMTTHSFFVYDDERAWLPPLISGWSRFSSSSSFIKCGAWMCNKKQKIFVKKREFCFGVSSMPWTGRVCRWLSFLGRIIMETSIYRIAALTLFKAKNGHCYSSLWFQNRLPIAFSQSLMPFAHQWPKIKNIKAHTNVQAFVIDFALNGLLVDAIRLVRLLIKIRFVIVVIVTCLFKNREV
jgi:hypothetical protein